MSLLQDTTAVVTGGSSGLGRGISRTFAEHGADVVVGDVVEDIDDYDVPTADLIEESTDSGATYVDCDVSSITDIEAAVDAAEQFGGIDVLVNNAAVFEPFGFLDVSEDEYNRLMDINLKGVFFACQAAAKRMIDDGGGNIINISSVSGLRGTGEKPAYSASKGGVRLLTYSLAHGLGPEGIRVNAIHPGPIKTPAALTEEGSEEEEEFLQTIPIRRRGVPDDIAGAATFLASDLSGFVHGHSLVVDGGWSCWR
jgi:NAD(P)-dependent dehydrogenase (short-subunit alcohol dehydrogenase family)